MPHCWKSHVTAHFTCSCFCFLNQADAPTKNKLKILKTSIIKYLVKTHEKEKQLMKKLRVVRKSFIGLVKKLSKQEHKAKKATSRLTKLKKHFSLLRSKLNRLTRLMVNT